VNKGTRSPFNVKPADVGRIVYSPSTSGAKSHFSLHDAAYSHLPRQQRDLLLIRPSCLSSLMYIDDLGLQYLQDR
jgi:hypothetical protein